MSVEIRRIITIVEETRTEGDKPVSPPTRRAAAVAVIRNPYVGTFVDDLTALSDIGAELGDILPRRAVAALGITGEQVESLFF